jgi:hypothetical protein
MAGGFVRRWLMCLGITLENNLETNSSLSAEALQVKTQAKKAVNNDTHPIILSCRMVGLVFMGFAILLGRIAESLRSLK